MAILPFPLPRPAVVPQLPATGAAPTGPVGVPGLGNPNRPFVLPMAENAPAPDNASVLDLLTGGKGAGWDENLLIQMGAGLLQNRGNISGLGQGLMAAAQARTARREADRMESARQRQMDQADRAADQRDVSLDYEGKRVGQADRRLDLDYDQFGLQKDRFSWDQSTDQRDFREGVRRFDVGVGEGRDARDQQLQIEQLRNSRDARNSVKVLGNAIRSDTGEAIGQVRQNGDALEWWDPDVGDWTEAPFPVQQQSDRNAYMGQQQFAKRFDMLNEQETGIRNLTRFMKTVENAPVGFERIGAQVAGAFQTLMGQELSEDAFQAQVANGLQQGLLGNIRLETIGGGVMTEPDAQRLIARLGGQQGGLRAALQNPEVVRTAIKDIMEDKYRNYEREYALLQSTPYAGSLPPKLNVDMGALFGGVRQNPGEARTEAGEAKVLSPGTIQIDDELAAELDAILNQ